jgi:hypothetical protein
MVISKDTDRQHSRRLSWLGAGGATPRGFPPTSKRA